MQLLTSLLELAGLLLVVLGIAIAVWTWLAMPPVAIAAAGVGLIGISYLITRRGGRS